MNIIKLTQLLALSGYFGLLGLILVWQIWLAPSQHVPTSIVLILLAVPLLFPLRGLLHGRPYTYAWSSFLALFYFILGVGEAYSSIETRYLGLLEVLFSLMLFVGCILYARLKGRQLKQQA